jgi:hypothetical protein
MMKLEAMPPCLGGGDNRYRYGIGRVDHSRYDYQLKDLLSYIELLLVGSNPTLTAICF